MNEPTTIPVGVFQTCFPLEAVDDEIVEDDEIFSVVAKVINPNDMVNSNTTVIISDNDGKDEPSCNITVSVSF